MFDTWIEIMIVLTVVIKALYAVLALAEIMAASSQYAWCPGFGEGCETSLCYGAGCTPDLLKRNREFYSRTPTFFNILEI